MPAFKNTHKAPKAAKKPVSETRFAHTRTDNYAWLKDENWQRVMTDPDTLNPEIREHLQVENTYSALMMADTDTLQQQLFGELKGRIKDDDGSVPMPDGDYEYAKRYRIGDQYGLYYRKNRTVKNAREEILLDGDALAKTLKAQGSSFFDIGTTQHSDDHKYFAYSVDVKGSERYRIYCIDVVAGKHITNPVEDTTGEFVWAKDNMSVFWVKRDANNRPSEIHSQNIVEPNSKPVLVYAEQDPGFFVSLSRSDTGNLIQIICSDHTTSETHLIPANKPQTAPLCVQPRKKSREYSLHDHGEDFYILTNRDGALDFKIMRALQSQPAAPMWEDYIPHKAGVLILAIETYQGYLVRLERHNALPRIIIHDLATGREHSIAFDEDAYALGLMGGYQFGTPWLRFSYSSPTTPGQIYDYHMGTKERVLRKSIEIPSGHNPDDYKAERIHIEARDGAQIPVTLLSRANFKRDGKSPCLLYGYGSYGITIGAGFRSSILSLVDRGFIYAIAHIRGGMAKGYQWYIDGKLDKKQKTFDDFIDVGNALAQLNYTSSGKIIAHGGSAGGLLVGAALNQAPQLFAGAIAAVPFVDVLNTMSDDSLPLTPPEWPEWGNPLTDEAAYKTIAAYCPYENIHNTHYPHTLITAGLTDPRVTYWEPAKWAAKLRDHQKGSGRILLKTNMDAGHQGETGRYNALKETAFEYAFALKTAGYSGEN